MTKPNPKPRHSGRCCAHPSPRVAQPGGGLSRAVVGALALTATALWLSLPSDVHAASASDTNTKVATSTAAGRGGVCGRTFKTVDELFKTLKGSAGFTSPAPHGHYLIMSEASTKAIWTFTIPGHPTHPTVVCRRPVEEDGRMSIAMDMICGGSQEDCDKLVAAFRKLNEKIRDSLIAAAAKRARQSGTKTE